MIVDKIKMDSDDNKDVLPEAIIASVVDLLLTLVILSKRQVACLIHELAGGNATGYTSAVQRPGWKREPLKPHKYDAIF
jgi:hypothetical protein